MSSNLGMKKGFLSFALAVCGTRASQSPARFGFPVEPQGLVMTRVDLNPTCSGRSAFRYRAA